MQKTAHSDCLEEKVVAILRGKTPAEKVSMIAAAHRTARMLAAAGIRFQHPNWTAEQIQAEVVKRVAGGAG